MNIYLFIVALNQTVKMVKSISSYCFAFTYSFTKSKLSDCRTMQWIWDCVSV